ncbi:MAG: PTS sugar transporter subunit IIC [Armatimonadota bacterium]
MPTFLERIEAPLMKVAGKLGQQPHLNAIRDGVVGALPLILIGSLFLLVAQPPLPSTEMMAAYGKVEVMGHPLVPTLLITFRVLVGLIAIYVAFGVAHGLAKRYDLDVLSAGLLSVAALLLINGVQLATVDGAVKPDKFLPIINLGSGGLFMAIILGLIVPEVQRFVKKHRLEIQMPAGVPPAVGRSFSALIPGLLVIVPLWVVVHLLGVDLFGAINTVLTKPVVALSSHGASVFVVLLVIILIDSILWLLGVHAVAILAPMAAVWLINMTGNSDAVSAGHAATALNTRESLQFFIWVGGSGATLVLPFLLLRAKSVSLRAIAKVGAIPALFNVNEPLIFGVPVMMNPVLVIPFIVAPIVGLTTTVFATHFGLVPVPHLVVPWTLPGPIGAFLATGGAWQAAVLSTLNIVLAGLIYWPFVRALDRRVAAQETVVEPVLV